MSEPTPEAMEAARTALKRGAAMGRPIPPCRCFDVMRPLGALGQCNGVCEEAVEYVARALDTFAAAAVEKERAEAWKEATIAWAVCASIHREYAKGRDALYTTRQADFLKHEADGRAKLGEIS